MTRQLVDRRRTGNRAGLVDDAVEPTESLERYASIALIDPSSVDRSTAQPAASPPDDRTSSTTASATDELPPAPLTSTPLSTTTTFAPRERQQKRVTFSPNLAPRR